MPTQKEQILKIQSALQSGKLSQLAGVFRMKDGSGPNADCFQKYESCVTSGPFDPARNLDCALDLIKCVKDVVMISAGEGDLSAIDALLAAALVETNRPRDFRATVLRPPAE